MNPEIGFKRSGIIWGQPATGSIPVSLWGTKLQGALEKMKRIGEKRRGGPIHAVWRMDCALNITRAVDESVAVCSSPRPSPQLRLSDDVSIWTGLRRGALHNALIFLFFFFPASLSEFTLEIYLQSSSRSRSKSGGGCSLPFGPPSTRNRIFKVTK